MNLMTFPGATMAGEPTDQPVMFDTNEVVSVQALGSHPLACLVTLRNQPGWLVVAMTVTEVVEDIQAATADSAEP